MDGYEAYQIFNAVRLHFTTSFDYFAYNGKSKTSLESFNLRKDKYSFHKLSRMYTKEELPYVIAVNFLKSDNNFWVSTLLQDSSDRKYKDWLKWQQARSYNFTNDVEKLGENFKTLIVCKEGQFPELLNLVFQDEIGYDSLVILDHFINLMKVWDTKIEDDFIWKGFYKKFLKYKPFFLHYAPLSEPHYKKIIVSNLK